MLRRPAILYPLWIALCAILFVALAGAEDPSRRRGRMISNEAGRRALTALRATSDTRFRDYEVVHVAWAKDRWVVLCDKVPHTALRQAMVVELDGDDGRVLKVRAPVR